VAEATAGSRARYAGGGCQGRPSAGDRRTGKLARKSFVRHSVWTVRPLAASAPAGWLNRVARCRSNRSRNCHWLRYAVAPQESSHRKQVVSAEYEQPPIRVRSWQRSLALRSTAAPAQQVGSGTGFARAACVAPLRRQYVSKGSLVSSRWAVARGRQPNSSVKRTSNGGPRLFASHRSVTPLAAAYLKR
jgi:hypothetical protein